MNIATPEIELIECTENGDGPCVSLRFSGVSIACLDELKKHSELSWSVDCQGMTGVLERSVVMPTDIRRLGRRLITERWLASVASAFESYDRIVSDLVKEGFTKRRARESALSTLPRCVEVRGEASGSLKAWLSSIPFHARSGSDSETREVTMLILNEFRAVDSDAAERVDAIIERDKDEDRKWDTAKSRYRAFLKEYAGASDTKRDEMKRNVLNGNGLSDWAPSV